MKKTLLAAVAAAGAMLLVPVAIVSMTMFILTGAQSQQNSSPGGGVIGVPAEYVDAVIRAGSICAEITPALIAAQIEAESGWNPRAGSPVGAQGISQFMPATWSSSGVDGDGDGVADVWNPTDAIISQGQYMCGQVAAVKAAGMSGDIVRLALAAYNAGFGAVQRYGGVPPYQETQNYVTKIIANAARFAVAEQVVVAASGDRQEIINYAQQYLGTPYVWGGNTPSGFDCSGFTRWVFSHKAGIELPRLSQMQMNEGRGVPLEEAQPGDLVWMHGGGHVGIYLGGGQVIHAPKPGDVVKISNIHVWDSQGWGIRRILND